MNNSTARWLSIAVVIILIIGGLWWLTGMQSPAMQGGGEMASTTTEGGSETSGAGSVTVQNSNGTVANVIADLQYGNRFSQLLAQTGVSSELSGKGPYTVFVSTDGAFGRLVPGTVNSLSGAELKRLVEYHIVTGKKLDVDAVNSGQVQALSGDPLNFQVNADDKVYVNSGYVLQAYSASNGIVYVINSVLIPPQKSPATL